jgi:hypothetical protein
MSQIKPAASKPIPIPVKKETPLTFKETIKFKSPLFAATKELSKLFNISPLPNQIEVKPNVELYNFNNPYVKKNDFHGPFAGPNENNDSKKDCKGPFPGPTG